MSGVRMQDRHKAAGCTRPGGALALRASQAGAGFTFPGSYLSQMTAELDPFLLQGCPSR
eukprot:CAMPEP_0175688630 /NCGR_PEP_ID=MMETSP0097-20121207/28976_1 /TAXON_ID=311494 /ORGANISM="Alexandrium monilatum, Strain CCMP3105" /LENGTH=58 /DNA_ID=CAMNT_0016995645 /DNA_START=41 /DNA_END=214 /DNA_ORIENTATION=-